MDQSDLLCDFEDHLNAVTLIREDKSTTSRNSESFQTSDTSNKDLTENGDEEIDPLDLIENCVGDGNEDLHSDNNSDVWKGSDSEEESTSFNESQPNSSLKTKESMNETQLQNNINEINLDENFLNTVQENLNNDLQGKEQIEADESLEKNKGCNDNASEELDNSILKTHLESSKEQSTIESNEKEMENDFNETTDISPLKECIEEQNKLLTEELESSKKAASEANKSNEIEETNQTTSNESEKKPEDVINLDDSDELIMTSSNNEKTPICGVMDDKKDEDSGDSGIVVNQSEDLNQDDNEKKECEDDTTQHNEKKDCKDDTTQQVVEDKNQENSSDTLNEKDKTEESIVVNEETVASDKPKDSASAEVEEKNSADGSDCDDMDYQDFDPSLLCPEVSMNIEEAPVTINQNVANEDGNTSPLPYEPVFSTQVDNQTGAEISFDLTPEEDEARRKRYNNMNPIEMTRIHCTSCNSHIGSALECQNNRFVHPMLKVLICKKCYDFYMSGEFDKDEDGSELYCRWCGQGGNVLCCSKCECVFCKKCIKTNLGRKKLTEVQKSDDWVCFRCNPKQLTFHRIACFELFEYIRRETARAATLNDPSFLKRDHSMCCDNKRKMELEAERRKAAKKKKVVVDPDFNPIEQLQQMQMPELEPKLPVSLAASMPQTNKLLQKPIVPPLPHNNTPLVMQQKNILSRPPITSQPMFSPPRPKTYMRPQMKTVGPRPALYRISTTSLPPLIPRMQPRTSISSPNIASPPTMTTSSPNANISRGSANVPVASWFEKTVRAAARVNSHLSYTLTQLNKAQTQARSVEELAVVHNKLQEILSGSINSLIQIRKNLRTEFIAGIKTTKFPPKKPDGPPTTVPLLGVGGGGVGVGDDDVIFVSAPPPAMSMAPRVQNYTNTRPFNSPVTNQNVPRDILSSARLSLNSLLYDTTNNVHDQNKNLHNNFNNNNNNNNSTSNASSILNTNAATSSNSQNTNTNSVQPPQQPRFYLKVKSVSELQNVPAECITIPDDPPLPRLFPPPPPPPLHPSPMQQPQYPLKLPLLLQAPQSVKQTVAPILLKNLMPHINQAIRPPPMPHREEPPKQNGSFTAESQENGIVAVQQQQRPSNNFNSTPFVVVVSDENPAKKRKLDNAPTASATTIPIATTTTTPAPTPTKTIISDEPRTFKSRYDMTDPPSKEMKRMMSVVVKLKRHDFSKYLKNGH